jgi:adenosine deaminase
MRVAGPSAYCFSALAFIFALAGCSATGSDSSGATAEQRTARAMEVAKADPLALRAFLASMPKGGDLHMHITGAVYAETFIKEGAEDKLCVNIASLSFVKPASATGAPCKKGDVPAAQAFNDQHLYDALVDAFSMRGFVPTPAVTGHDHFFDSFSRFGAVDDRHAGEWLDEVASRAAAQNEQYLELMVVPPFDHTAAIAKELGWNADRSLSEFREQLLAKGLRDDVAVARAYLDQAESLRRQREHCGDANESAACSVQIRYLYTVLRAFPPAQVFAQTLLGFEAGAVDPRFVGINYVQPEDNHVAMSDSGLHMKMVEYLHGVYPGMHISLHAGELAPGMVPPEGLCCHIRLAVEVGHAERIGHGVDVMQEDRPYDLLKEMSAKHVMVEINLTSNDVILGLTGDEDPLPIYLKYGVPVALSTDDEGVSRIDLSHEFVRAVETYGLRYPDLKRMVRTSIENSFLAGPSLWQERDRYDRVVPACSGDKFSGSERSPACAAFLQSSERARQQWELERRFSAFQARH